MTNNFVTWVVFRSVVKDVLEGNPMLLNFDEDVNTILQNPDNLVIWLYSWVCAVFHTTVRYLSYVTLSTNSGECFKLKMLLEGCKDSNGLTVSNVPLVHCMLCSFQLSPLFWQVLCSTRVSVPSLPTPCDIKDMEHFHPVTATPAFLGSRKILAANLPLSAFCIFLSAVFQLLVTHSAIRSKKSH